MKRLLLALLAVILLIDALSLFVFGDDPADALDKSLSDALPDEVKKYLSGDGEALTSELLSGMGVSFFLDYSQESLRDALLCAFKAFSSLFALTLLACVLIGASSSFCYANTRVFTYAALCSVTLAAFTSVYPFITCASEALTKLAAFFGGIAPVVSAIYLCAGHPTSAAIGAQALALLCSVIGDFCPSVLLPLVKLDFALGFSDCLSPSGAASEAGKIVRRIFLFFSAFLMCVMTTVFAFQSNIASRSDSVGLRALRFAAGRSIPVVGSSVSEAAATMLGSLSLIKSVTGGAGIAAVLILILPAIFSLVLAKLSLDACASLAGAAECSQVQKILSYSAKTLDFVTAVCAIFAVASIFELSVLMNTDIQVISK